MDLNKTIKNLSKLSSNSRKEGYIGDASEYAFRMHVLILLKKIAETPKQMKYFWQTMEELKEKTAQEITR